MRIHRPATLAAFAVLVAALSGCSSDTEEPHTTVVTVTSTSETSSATSSRPAAPPTSGVASTAAETTRAIARCATDKNLYQRGTTWFTDGTTGWTSYCAERFDQANPSTAAPAGPAVGASCHGYQINSRAQAADGTTLVCNNYRWEVYSGQTGDSPWLRGQREWTDCIARNTEEYCRATLNRG